MAVRPRASSLTTEEVFEYLPTTGSETLLLDFRKDYGFKGEDENAPFWHSVSVCIDKANKGEQGALDDFKAMYGVVFPRKNKREQIKYLTAAYQLEKNTMEQLFDYAEEHNYPLVNIIQLKQDLPQLDEMVEDEQTFFDESEGAVQIRGPETRRGSMKMKENSDPYEKLMNAINYGIKQTSNENNFFVHTIFEKIDESLKERMERSHPTGTHMRLITMIPYVFKENTPTLVTRLNPPETHATLIICDITEKGEKRICFTEPNRIMFNYFLKNPVKGADGLKEYIETKFKELLGDSVKVNVKPFLHSLTMFGGILEENLNFLQSFANEAKENKYFLDLPVYNDFGPNCTRLCIYIIFYYCFVSTKSDELTQFAIKINPDNKPISRRLEMQNETRTYDKIKPLLYGLLRASESASTASRIGVEHSFNPNIAKQKMEEEDGKTANEKLQEIIRRNKQKQEEESKKPKKPKKPRRGGKSYRYHEHLY